MIVGNIARFENYLPNVRFKKAFEFLKGFKGNPLPVGRYEIDGGDVFALVQEYEPAGGGRYESHRLYADIQYLHAGNENIGCARIENAVVDEDMTPASDAILYRDVKNSFMISLFEGDFAVFFPEDLHQPGVKNTADKVVKVVVKIRV